MTISDDFISTSAYTDVKAILLSASIISSTISGSVSSSSSASIVGAFSDEHKNHPQVVMSPAIISEQDYKFGGAYGKRTINMVIECYHPNGRAVDYMADMVKAALANNPVDGLSLVGVSEDPDFASPGDNKVKSKILVFTYVRE